LATEKLDILDILDILLDRISLIFSITFRFRDFFPALSNEGTSLTSSGRDKPPFFEYLGMGLCRLQFLFLGAQGTFYNGRQNLAGIKNFQEDRFIFL
jgi:hypothetical protein